MGKIQEIGRLAYSISEVAQALGVSSRTVRTLVKNGELGHFRLGARVLVEVDALRLFIEQRTQKGGQDNV